MAQRVQVQLIDDLNGEQAQETVLFSLDGVSYEIDLTGENAATLRASLTEYLAKGRKASSRRGGKTQETPGTSTSKARREETQRIRQWATDNGYTPSSRGRITQSIIDAYTTATR
ncbi:histone-like nucleoid-structuring protein Lsr2 [Arthrobacter sp. H41]|uniref:histone-like nucleoid-structuring protein Lsr2 n=1 Tax=Arthrobacter sp. H41 TaxID=1312978 RepID=UPI00047D0A9B|nr:Lsr2 family protein [Arthrobacter sp. H41]